MISTLQPEAKAVHPLSRFVTVQAIALLLDLKTEQIYRIDCWRYVVHVVGKGVSTFVSYADMPPVLGVEPPKPEDINCWRKRWRRNKYKAPNFWTEFYQQQFELTPSLTQRHKWGELVSAIAFALPDVAVPLLQRIARPQR
ncbi:MAG TPA: hypothetical protein V6D50_09550 [Chroococcales cyanobacterium]|jgi:hypothetical protein